METLGHPFGGLGLWTWCVTPKSHTPLWLTVPVANFLGWWVVILMYSLVLRLGAKYLHPETRSTWPSSSCCCCWPRSRSVAAS